MAKILIIYFFIVFSFSLNNSEAASDTLYINSGDISFHPLGFNPFPFIAFNKDPLFDNTNSFLECQRNDTIQLSIINNDSIEHIIHVNNGQYSTGPISPGSISTINLTFANNGLYSISDSSEAGRFLGLSTFLKVWDSTANNFYWNLNEIQSDLQLKIRQGIPFDSDTFNPDYFMINGNTHPFIGNDSLATVNGHVGDSIYIFVYNSGKMYHAIHFHGYHVEIIASNSNQSDVGRIKDSIPIKPESYQVYLLIPNQSGIFPVHDHNLIATTGGGNYPNGMMVMMNISP